MSRPQKSETPLAGGVVAKENNQSEVILTEEAGVCKRLSTLQANAALRGIAVHELASGGFLVGRWGYAKELPDLRAVTLFLGQQGVSV